MPKLVLHGAGAAGRETLASLRKQGIEPLCFADNDKTRWNGPLDGVGVVSPETAKSAYPDATWVVTIYKADARDVHKQLTEMNVKMAPLGKYLPFCRPMPTRAINSLISIVEEEATKDEVWGQVEFRRTLDHDAQLPPSPISALYFPDFIKKINSEVFVDCGAADGDSIAAFGQWSKSWKSVFAFEPDEENYEKLRMSLLLSPEATAAHYAVSDFCGKVKFSSEGTIASRVDPDAEESVDCTTIDVAFSQTCPPSFIKMDIEGSELRAIWGGRQILKEHSPVLAICAYHEPDHLWEIPLLIHAIQPEYELRLRRYSEGTRELVWYAIPKGRLQ